MILYEQTKNKYNFDAIIISGNKLKICCMRCDICQKEYEKQYYLVLRGRKYVELDTCGSKDCVREKTKRTNLFKYGVESTNQLLNVKEKKKEGCKRGYIGMIKSLNQKYNVNHPHQIKEVRNKYQNTMMERYGVFTSVDLESARKNSQKALKNNIEQVIEKRKQTCLKRYNVDNPSKFEKFIIKRKETNFVRARKCNKK